MPDWFVQTTRAKPACGERAQRVGDLGEEDDPVGLGEVARVVDQGAVAIEEDGAAERAGRGFRHAREWTTAHGEAHAVGGGGRAEPPRGRVPSHSRTDRDAGLMRPRPIGLDRSAPRKGAITLINGEGTTGGGEPIVSTARHPSDQI